MSRNELKINPNYKPIPAPDISEFRGRNDQEYSHMALDVVGDKLFLRTVGDKPVLQMCLEIDPFPRGSIGDRLEFNLEVGRAIGEAILDLCKEEEGGE